MKYLWDTFIIIVNICAWNCYCCKKCLSINISIVVSIVNYLSYKSFICDGLVTNMYHMSHSRFVTGVNHSCAFCYWCESFALDKSVIDVNHLYALFSLVTVVNHLCALTLRALVESYCVPSSSSDVNRNTVWKHFLR